MAYLTKGLSWQKWTCAPRLAQSTAKSDLLHLATTMSKAKKTDLPVAGLADDIEAAFYEALQNADLEKLMACWADEDDLICVHPSGPRLVGVGAIRAAFEAMFSKGSIRAWPEAVRRIESLTSSVHNLRERIEVMTQEGPQLAYVVATNVYHKTAQGWRMVAHHASPASEDDAQEITQTPHLLH
jgi:ketosteroid isomerase-like protein